MYETRYYQIKDSRMSNNTQNVKTSKKSGRKSSFYRHQDPTKLNYYARFSPNRKKLYQPFQQDILSGRTALRPRSNNSSVSSQRSSKREVLLDQREEQTFQVIEQEFEIINERHQNRGQIYIDEQQQPHEVKMQPTQYKQDIYEQNIRYCVDSKQRQADNISRVSSSQLLSEEIQVQEDLHEGQSFQRMVQQSSSDQNQTFNSPLVPSKGAQMLIQDDDSQDLQQDFSQNSQQHLKSAKVTDGSDKKMLDLLKSVEVFRQQPYKKQSAKQICSQNISFSLDSDLSMIQQKWSSYFDTQNLDSLNHQIKKQQPSWIESHIQKNKAICQPEMNQRKISESSEEQLPSFSNPDTSNYKNVVSQRSSNIQQESYQNNCDQACSNSQAKQFKRQYTFGNQLSAAFMAQNNNQIFTQSKKIEPFFKKIISKHVLQNFIVQKKSKKGKFYKKLTLKNDTKQLNKHSAQLKPFKLNQKSHIQKLKKKQIKQARQNKQIQKNQVQNEFKFQTKQQQEENGNKISQSLSSSLYKVDNISEPINQASEIVQVEQLSSAKNLLKAKKHQLWQQKNKSMLQNEYKQKKKQKQQKKQFQYHLQKQQKIIDKKQCQNQNQKIQSQSKSSLYHQQKTQQLQSYAKIHSQKKHIRGRKGSYQQRRKISQSHHQSSGQDLQQNNNSDQQFKKIDQESLTTATQEHSQNTFYTSVHQPKNQFEYNNQIQNLKKYLQRIEKQDVFKKNNMKGHKSVRPDNSVKSDQQTQVLDTRKATIIQETQCLSEIRQRNQEPQLQMNLKRNIELIKIVDQEQNKEETQSYSKPQELYVRQIWEGRSSQVKSKLQILQLSQTQPQSVPQTKHQRKMAKSLAMLESLIPHLPKQFIPTYEKIYSQVYQQQLMYKHRIQKQQFLLDFMQQIIRGKKQNIDCQSFLSYDNQVEDKKGTDSLRYNDESKQNQDRLHVLMNKHIILSLVRQLASKFN